MRSVSPKDATCCESDTHSNGLLGGSGKEWQHRFVEEFTRRRGPAHLKCSFTRHEAG